MNGDPEERGQPEYRIAIVQAKIVLLLFAVGIQLFLLTVTVDRFLAGDPGGIVALALTSGATFLVALGVWRAFR